ncbi:PilZ domain-containing protein [Microvirga sp. GCM10011540]|uniref:PilZ domain-containing protein n=1 Tax=Microvirga sp. GCM10011540 TaxID=3317338 RepID=UPI00361249D4
MLLSEAQESSSAERRRSNKRTRTLLEGRIIFNNRFSLIECTVRNISDSGAQISFAHPVEVPNEFDLEIPRRELSLKARVVWSNGKNYGVMFTSPPQPTLPTDNPEKPRETAMDCSPEQIAVEAPATHSVREILDYARHALARAIGVPASQVRLRLEVDYSGPSD